MKTFYGGIFLDKKQLEGEGIFHPIKVEYYKVLDKDINDYESYGIEVIKTEYRKENINIEKSSVIRVSDDEEEVSKILDQLKEGQVTPATVEYIIEDRKGIKVD